MGKESSQGSITGNFSGANTAMEHGKLNTCLVSAIRLEAMCFFQE